MVIIEFNEYLLPLAGDNSIDLGTKSMYLKQ